jgi:hypothetical protein
LGDLRGTEISLSARGHASSSLIETCKINVVDPPAYLADVLSRLINGWPMRQIDELMPWVYATPTPSRAATRGLLGHVDPDHRTTEAFHESFDPTFLEAPIRATDALMAALNNLAHQEPIRARNGSRNTAVSGGRRNLSSEGRNGMTKFIYSDDNSVKHKVEAHQINIGMSGALG